MANTNYLNKVKRILIAPLDWGLGHATRCIPVIRELVALQHEVIIAADKSPAELLKREFPALRFIHLPGYKVEYPKNGNMILKMLLQAPGMLRAISRENREVNRMVDELGIDLIISDNRFGMWSDKVPCIFITHQLSMRAPWGQWLANKLNTHFINKFDTVWVPDNLGEASLAGDLSKPSPGIRKDIRYIGPLSRFSKAGGNTGDVYDFIAIISGPEPQRSNFEKLMLSSLSGSGKKGIVVRGLPLQTSTEQPAENIEVFPHLGGDQLLEYILRSRVVIARSGYTTIMELAALGKRAVLIPTPGQTEQEYLARFHADKGHCLTANQENADLLHLMDAAMQVSPFPTLIKNTSLRKLLEKLSFRKD